MVADSLPAHLQAALGEDVHRPGSIDGSLLQSQTFVTLANQPALYQQPGVPDSRHRWPRPWLEEIVADVTAGSVHEVQRAVALRRWVAAIPRAFPEGGRTTRDGYWGEDYRAFLCGGTEEEIVRKGSPLAAELSRVLVTVSLLAGLPARMVFLYADQPPYRHAVAEIYVSGRWSVFDAVSDRSYVWPKHGYLSAWEIHRMPALIDGLQDHRRLPYVHSRFYRMIAIARYDPWDPTHRFPWDAVDPETAARIARGEAS